MFSFGVLAPAQAGAHPRASILTFVRPRRRLTPAPTAGCRGRRAQMLSRLARAGPPVDAKHRFAMKGLALTASSTTARSSCRASSRGLGHGFGDFPHLEVAAVVRHA